MVLATGCHYHTKEHDDLRAIQNSGVSIVATTMQIASAKDKNPVFGELCFYGVITEIWDLDYTMFRIPIFKCDWVDNKNGIRVDDLGFTLVDFSKMAHKSDPFILASQAKFSMYKMNLIQDGQLFYQLLNKTSWKGTRVMISWITLLNTIQSYLLCHKLKHLMLWMTLMQYVYKATMRGFGLRTNSISN